MGIFCAAPHDASFAANQHFSVLVDFVRPRTIRTKRPGVGVLALIGAFWNEGKLQGAWHRKGNAHVADIAFLRCLIDIA